MTTRTQWIPNIFYEEDENGLAGGYPFIEVPRDKDMPNCLFICGIRELDTKVDEAFEKEAEMYSYGNMSVLKEKLPPALFDEVRIALGLKPLHEAVSVADKMLESVIQGVKKEYEKQKNVDELINKININNNEE